VQCCVRDALQEDENIVLKRTAVKALFEKVKMAIDDVQYMAEKIKRKEDDRETVRVECSGGTHDHMHMHGIVHV